jgi:NAD(P)-dependent dehydrogenase (short-subunit alcohol dehydrogenase family)
VTGANRGLGLAIARQLVADGAETIAVVRKTSPELDALGCAQIIQDVDVTDAAAVAEMASSKLQGGALDIVINNAGYFTAHHETMDALDFGEELKQIDICAVGPLRITAALRSKGLIKKNGGKVIVISSQAGSAEWRKTQNKDEGGDYGHHMSRAACNIAAVLMSEEIRKEGISVTILHPGFNRTDMTRKYAHIWDIEGAVDARIGAKRVLHEVGRASLAETGKFINCEDGLEIPF